ncbi:hypothetical protein ACIBEH_01230 [Nocardia salmonicida]|uniref:hypothetical protein n=2 Tax=Nocardiaceae TaxID=85025 RepID=UPI00265A1E38|nr:hypothetical protein [Nocardia sp. PE-7]WKG09736.1 hypothetical protein QX204_32915 [Nocardia sp. PE-7]
MNDQQRPQGQVPQKSGALSSPPVAVLLGGIGSVVVGLFGLSRAAAALSALHATSTRWEQSQLPVDWNLQMLEHQIDLAVGAVLAVLLGLGGVLVLGRRARGLNMVIIGSGLAIFALWGAASMSATSDELVFFVLYSLLPCGTLLAALLPSSQRWIDSGPNAQLAQSNTPRPPVPPYN